MSTRKKSDPPGTGASQDSFDARFADYTGVGPDFVQMRPGAGYDLVRYMPEALRVGDTR